MRGSEKCWYDLLLQIVFSMASGPPEEITEIIHNQFPEYNLTNLTISGNPSVLEWKTLYTALHMTLPVTPVYIVIIYIRKAIIKTLSMHEDMSENTKNMHRQLLTVRIRHYSRRRPQFIGSDVSSSSSWAVFYFCFELCDRADGNLQSSSLGIYNISCYGQVSSSSF